MNTIETATPRRRIPRPLQRVHCRIERDREEDRDEDPDQDPLRRLDDLEQQIRGDDDPEHDKDHARTELHEAFL